VVDGLTGTFFDAPVVDHVARAITMATKQARDEDELQAHAELSLRLHSSGKFGV
jgi:hypothetical protein